MLRFTALVALSSVAFAATNPCDLKRVDDCVKDFIPYSVNTKASVSEKDINQDCAKSVGSLQCLKDWGNAKCAKTGLTNGVFKLMVEGIETLNSQRCDKAHPKRKEYEQYIPCLNKVGNKLRNCQRKAISEFEAVAKLPVNDRVPNACCSFKRLDSCVRQVAEKDCSKAHASYVASILDGVSEAIVDSVCTKYRGDVCSKLPPLRVKSKNSWETMVTPVLGILNL